MRRINMRRVAAGVAALVTASLGVVVAIPAQAASPILEQFHYSESGSHIEQEEHPGFCPNLTFDVLYQFTVEGNVLGIVRGDGIFYFADRFRVSESYTNVENGETLSSEIAGQFRDQTITVNDDGTITITATFSGSSRVLGTDGKLLFRDAGRLTFQVVIDYNGTLDDPSDDEFVADIGLVSSSGRHDTADRDFCEDLETYLS